MTESSLIALIGLLLLIPLEIVILILLHVLKYRYLPGIRVHRHKKGEHYGWEDYLKLPTEKKQSKGHGRRSFLKLFLITVGVIIVAGLLIGAVVAAILFLSGTPSFSEIPLGITSGLSKNVTNETTNETINGTDADRDSALIEPKNVTDGIIHDTPTRSIDAIVDAISAIGSLFSAVPDSEDQNETIVGEEAEGIAEEQDETRDEEEGGAAEEAQDERMEEPSQEESQDYPDFTGIDLPSVNLTGIIVSMPELNFSGFSGGLNNAWTYVIAAFILIVLAIAASIYIFNRRKLSVIKKARKTAEKLSKKAEKKAVEEKDPWAYETSSGFRNWINVIAALIALSLLAVILYVFLGRLEWTAGSLKNSLSGFFGFLSAYAFYVIVGIVLLIVALAVVILVEKKFNLRKL